ncbi:hypothetical protein AVEN_145105-1, partial [Araneus ventricosus]
MKFAFNSGRVHILPSKTSSFRHQLNQKSQGLKFGEPGGCIWKILQNFPTISEVETFVSHDDSYEGFYHLVMKTVVSKDSHS